MDNEFKNEHQVTIGVEFGSFGLKINNQIIASTSTFSTNSSNHSSPAINNKIQNFKPPSTDNEIMLPKIYLNEDEVSPI